MTRFAPLFLLLFISTLSACSSASEEKEALTLGDSLATVRPDANRPVGEELSVPPYWLVRLDEPGLDVTIGSNPDSADIFFVNMTPGWHITSGPAAIFYHPASAASGSYRAHTDVYLFNPGDRNEGFGLFFAGKDLKSDTLSYSYFLIRNSGEFLIKSRDGDETRVIHDWTPSDAILTYTDTTTSSVLNSLSVEVGPTEVAFAINDEIVSILSQSEIGSEGVVGLRVNHGLNLHVSDLKVE